MAKILILAKSGFGKTTSIGEIPELGLKGLDPKTTYLISCVNKPLPFRGANKKYVITTFEQINKGNRIITNDAETVAKTLDMLANSPYKNIVLDDMNYISQDYYMKNALKGGWDTPKKIGYFMGKIFSAIEKYGDSDKNIIILAHGEEVPQQDGRIYLKMKTTGKMVDEYVTPEGKFDVTLVGRSRFDAGQKKIVKEFITNEDEFTSSPKSPYGMFPELYIPNDLGLVVAKVNEYYNG